MYPSFPTCYKASRFWINMHLYLQIHAVLSSKILEIRQWLMIGRFLALIFFQKRLLWFVPNVVAIVPVATTIWLARKKLSWLTWPYYVCLQLIQPNDPWQSCQNQYFTNGQAINGFRFALFEWNQTQASGLMIASSCTSNHQTNVTVKVGARFYFACVTPITSIE